MRRLLVVGVGVLVGCKGNFVTVTVDGLPCDTDTLQVDVSIEGEGSSSTVTFGNAMELDDGHSSFALDMGDHKDGTLEVLVTANEVGGAVMTAMGSIELPATSLEITVPGAGCVMAGVDANLDCWGGFATSNFDPCAPSFPKAVDFVGGTIDTDDPTKPPYLFDPMHPVRLLHVKNMLLPAEQTYTVTGSRPLLIVVDGTAEIDGTILFESSKSSPDCVKPMKLDPAPGPGGAGGGGGGFGTIGGNGGNSDNLSDRGQAGGPSTTSALVPLRTGCEGAAGATTGGTAAGAPGEAAGGIEISAMMAVAVTGNALIELNGGGGTGGGKTVDGSFYAGGGGGSSGGAILLEAPQIMVDGHVCAVGGGGGGGGESGTSGVSGDGSRLPSCVDMGAGGGGASGPSNHGSGGNGGGFVPPTDGEDGSAIVSGGGGGGAVGQIRFHATNAPLVTQSAVVVPSFTR